MIEMWLIPAVEAVRQRARAFLTVAGAHRSDPVLCRVRVQHVREYPADRRSTRPDPM